jgi:hypothetical protein
MSDVVVYSGTGARATQAHWLLVDHGLHCQQQLVRQSRYPYRLRVRQLLVPEQEAARARQLLETLELSETLETEQLSHFLGWRLGAAACCLLGVALFLWASFLKSAWNILGVLGCCLALVLLSRSLGQKPASMESKA